MTKVVQYTLGMANGFFTRDGGVVAMDSACEYGPDLVVEGAIDLQPWGLRGQLVETPGHSDGCSFCSGHGGPFSRDDPLAALAAARTEATDSGKAPELPRISAAVVDADCARLLLFTAPCRSRSDRYSGLPR